MDETERLLKELSEASGLSGHEDEVRALLRDRLTSLGTIEYDRLGSIICRQSGENDSPRVMIAAHMDEVGFMVSQIMKNGGIRFVPVGMWMDQVLPAQRFVVQTSQGDVTGVISTIAPHGIPKEERNRVLDSRFMVLDIGAASEEEVRSLGVRLGDPIVPVSAFEVLANGCTYLGKAWDDRVGCGVMVEAMRRLADEGHPNTVFAVGTVQEEGGHRGAQTSAQLIEPDVAIVLESSILSDLGAGDGETPQARLGRGPVLVLIDPGLIPNLYLRDLVVQVAEQAKIPLQIQAWTGGGDDGAAIHLVGAGVPTVVLSVPTRNVHCHTGIIHREDYDNTVKLLVALICSLGAEAVSGLTDYAARPRPARGRQSQRGSGENRDGRLPRESGSC